MIQPGLAEPLEAQEPPEVRGADRADVALLVATPRRRRAVARPLRRARSFLRAGDLLVVNTSATLPAALPATARRRGRARCTSRRPWTRATGWSSCAPPSGCRCRAPQDGRAVELPGGASAKLLARYLGSKRLSVARLSLGEPILDYLRRHGHPIRYRHTPGEWPIDSYQTVFALRPRQRRDAERRAAVHGRARGGAGGPRRAVRAADAARGRVVARAGREPVPRALPRAREPPRGS